MLLLHRQRIATKTMCEECPVGVVEHRHCRCHFKYPHVSSLLVLRNHITQLGLLLDTRQEAQCILLLCFHCLPSCANTLGLACRKEIVCTIINSFPKIDVPTTIMSDSINQLSEITNMNAVNSVW